MHTHSLSDWQHDHVFLGVGHDRNERRTWARPASPRARRCDGLESRRRTGSTNPRGSGTAQSMP